jgi:hypothetical protein
MLFRRACFVITLAVLLSALDTGVFAVTISSLTHERQAAPGETYHGTVEIVNNSPDAAVVKVYQTDYLFQSDGSNTFGTAGELARSNAAWLDFSPNRIIIPPNSTYLINYSVNVPADSTLSGTYWSMLMVEESAPAETTSSPADQQAAISQIVRYGVQCITHIGTSGESDLQIVEAKLSADSGNVKELLLDVRNDGERWAVPVVWTELFDNDGKTLGKFDGEKKRIFPGTSVRYKIAMNDSLKGNYKALIVLDTGGENVIGAKYDLEF